MSSSDEVNALLRRAEKFRKDAINTYKEGYYDIACFYSEQAVQLRLKAYILKNLAFMPRIHELRGLLSIIYNFTKDERIREFMEANRRELRDLEESYTEARYGIVSYTEEDAKECLNVMEAIFILI